MLSTSKVEKIRKEFGSIGKWQAARKQRSKRTLSAMMAIVIVIGIFGTAGKLFRKNSDDGIFSGLVVQGHALEVGIPKMAAAGWAPWMYNYNDAVDPSKDTSNPGQRSFVGSSEQSIKSIPDAIALVSNGTWAAEAIVLANIEATGCTRDEYFSSDNWIIFQSKVKFHYNQMTAWTGKEIITVSDYKVGNPWDIFAAFVAPRSDIMTFLKGACGNISLLIPTPDEPEYTKDDITTTTSKSEATTGVTTTTGVFTTGESTTESQTNVVTTTGVSTTANVTTTAANTTTKVAPTKDPSEDPNNNTSIPTWIHDGSETTHSVVNATSATNSNFLQIDPEAAALAAEKAAQAIIDAANAALAAAIEAAKDTGAGVVDDNEEHVAITVPTNASGTTDPNWSPFS